MVNNRTSLDPRWTTHNVKTASGFMVATIRVIRKSPDVQVIYDRSTQTWSGDFEEVFVGKARIQPYGIIGDQIVGQDPTGRRLMRLQVESKLTLINVDDMIEVISSPEDPELELFTMEVRGTIGSSNAWVTDIVAEADLKRADPRPANVTLFSGLDSFPSPLTYPTE